MTREHRVSVLPSSQPPWVVLPFPVANGYCSVMGNDWSLFTARQDVHTGIIVVTRYLNLTLHLGHVLFCEVTVSNRTCCQLCQGIFHST